MSEPENARDLFEQGLPDVDPSDPAGTAAAEAADDVHGEVDDLGDDADEDAGHGTSSEAGAQSN